MKAAVDLGAKAALDLDGPHGAIGLGQQHVDVTMGELDIESTHCTSRTGACHGPENYDFDSNKWRQEWPILRKFAAILYTNSLARVPADVSQNLTLDSGMNPFESGQSHHTQ